MPLLLIETTAKERQRYEITLVTPEIGGDLPPLLFLRAAFLSSQTLAKA